LRPGSPAFHCDATQAVGRIPVRFHELGLTSLSLSAHKFHGPKGIGTLLLRRGTELRPRVYGGHQQQGRRPGTEPVALAVGLATALELACREMGERLEKVERLRNQFLDQLRASGIGFILNGPLAGGVPLAGGARGANATPRAGGVPHTLNLSFPGVRGDALLMALDLAGVACATGSACSSGSLLPSPVLQAMKLPEDRLRSALRFSFSALLSEEAVNEAARRVARVADRLCQAALEDPVERELSFP
jgi:cysteine desulfurase